MMHGREHEKTLQTRRTEVTATSGGSAIEAPPAVKVPALTIVWHPDARRVGERFILYPLATGGTVDLSRNEPDFSYPGALLGGPLSDPFLSRKPITLSAAPNGGIALVATPDGTRLVCGSTVVEDRIVVDAEALARGVPLLLSARVVLLLHLMEPAIGATESMLGMVGESAGTRAVRTHVERVADVGASVLIRGESGTGKELVARAIHDRSPRRMGPFVAVNLATLPRELAAAQLFGAQRGAYTGAAQTRDGFFQAARGGTLFLDEVGEAQPELQAMLLRVLEEREMYPVGAERPVPVDVRVIAATDANLEAQIEGGRFKTPLLHRLAEYEIRIPPLRERREDIGLLVRHFAEEELRAIGEGHRLAAGDPHTEPWLPASAAALLVTFDWPGNIRQLRNVVRRIVIGSRGQAVTRLDPSLEAELRTGRKSASTPPHGGRAPHSGNLRGASNGPAPRRKPADVTEDELTLALRAHLWDLKAAADALGIPRPSIYDLIAKSPTIRTAGDLSPEEIERAFHATDGDVDRMVQALQVSKRALLRRLKELGLREKKA
ncbi:MAG: sigma-54 dependent transcriptional regulator [Polyangiaceae bacterium]